jgi:flagellum-specific peptidoglycan hydrolase FlgJ
MKMKTLRMAPVVTVLACVSASAQITSNSAQDHTSSRGQRNNAQSASESPLSPLLGAPQDDEETYLPDTRSSSPAQDHGSTRNNQTREAQSKRNSPLSPVLGPPQDYEDTYLSGLGNGPAEQAAAAQAASYRLTPVEQLLAPELTERPAVSSAGTSSHSDAGGTRIAGQRDPSRNFGPVSVTPVSSSASQLNSLGDPPGSDKASTIYRSPW